MQNSPSKEKWQRIINKWAQSGISQKQFCEENKINFNTFHFYKKKLKNVLALVELTPITLSPEKITINLQSKNISISIPESFCRTTLLRLLNALKGNEDVY